MSETSPRSPTSLQLDEKRRIDVLCDRFEAAWKGAPSASLLPRIEDYLAEIEESERSALLCQLISLDAVYRRMAGERPQPQDYQVRFPGLDPAWLERTLQPESPQPSEAAPPTSQGERQMVSVPFSLANAVPAGSSWDMGRAPRRIADGLVDHALRRGHNRTPVFFAAADCQLFLPALRQTRQRYPFRRYADCLSRGAPEEFPERRD